MITATITGDCRYLSLVLTGAQGMAQVTVTNGQYQYQSNVNLPSGGASYNSVLDLQASVGTRDGIFQISMTDANGTRSYAAAFGKCSLLCCIAKKMESIIGCDCGCSKCSTALNQAERVNLLIVSVESALSQLSPEDPTVNAGIYASAQEKYDKAVELCSVSWGCGC